MEEFNVKCKCDICNQDKMCTEVIVLNENKQQQVKFWCKDCIDKINEEEAKQQELEIQEVYQDIIRSSY